VGSFQTLWGVHEREGKRGLMEGERGGFKPGTPKIRARSPPLLTNY